MSISAQLPRSSPENQGVSSISILNFLETIEQNNLELHSFMLLRHGYVISEGWWSPYSSDRRHMLFSLSKSFTSTAIGLAINEGLLTLDDSVLSFFQEDAPESISDNLSKLRIRHLLSMSTGHAEDTTGKLQVEPSGNWVKAFLHLPIEYEPGTHFVYNSGATYMLSAILQKAAGQTLIQFLTLRLFEPLQIEGATWETCPRGINTGGWGLSIKTEDIAKFGQLYLQKGGWNGVQLLSQNWVEEATTYKISNGNDENSDWSQGYCFQFWRCRHKAYRGDGAFGQYCIVMPEQDAVIAITSGLNDMQAVLNAIWECLLPAMKNEVLLQDKVSTQILNDKLSSLVLSPPKLRSNSQLTALFNSKTYQMESTELGIEVIKLLFKDDICTLIIKNGNNNYEVNCGIEKWINNETTILGFSSTVAASASWHDDTNLIFTWRFIETPFCDTINCHFEDNYISIKLSRNVSFGSTDFPAIKGYVDSANS